jgi:PAS domain S-box-containing protein
MDLTSVISAAVGGGVLTQLVNFFNARRTAKKDDFNVIIERWEKDNARLRSEVDAMQSAHLIERKALMDELDRMRREIGDLRGKVALMEHAQSDVPAPQWLKDLDGRVLSVNRAFEQAFGKVAAECLGRTEREIWGDDIGANLMENDQQVIHLGQPLHTVEEYGEHGTWFVLKFNKMAGSAKIGVGALAFPAL